MNFLDFGDEEQPTKRRKNTDAGMTFGVNHFRYLLGKTAQKGFVPECIKFADAEGNLVVERCITSDIYNGFVSLAAGRLLPPESMQKMSLASLLTPFDINHAKVEPRRLLNLLKEAAALDLLSGFRHTFDEAERQLSRAGSEARLCSQQSQRPTDFTETELEIFKSRQLAKHGAPLTPSPSSWHLVFYDYNGLASVAASKFYAASAEPPLGWPPVSAIKHPTIDAVFDPLSPAICFDFSGMVRMFTFRRIGQTVMGLSYRRFDVSGDTIKWAYEEAFDNPHLPSRNDSWDSVVIAGGVEFVRQLSLIVADYLDRIKCMDVDYVALDRLRCLLVDPTNLLVDRFGRIYHVPNLRPLIRHDLFVPPIFSKLAAADQLRAAILFSLARLVYARMFYRSIDDDFPVASLQPNATFADWTGSVCAAAFPTSLGTGEATSPDLVHWLMLCMTNRATTTTLRVHPLFTQRQFPAIAPQLTNPNRRHFIETTANFNAQWSRIVAMQRHFPAYEIVFPPQGSSEWSNVISDVSSNLERNDQFGAPEFKYADSTAEGIAVGQSIVMQVFEQFKIDNLFGFDVERDMLVERVRCDDRVYHKLRTLMLLICWCLTNNVRAPYLIAPEILLQLFSLPVSATSAWRQAHFARKCPAVVNGLLDYRDDKTLLGGVAELDDATELQPASLSAVDSATNESFRQTGPLSVDSVGFHLFRQTVELHFKDADSLCYALSHRLYGSSRTTVITPAIAIGSLSLSEPILSIDLIAGLEVYVRTAFDINRGAIGRSLFKNLKTLQMAIEQGNLPPEKKAHACSLMSAARIQAYAFFLRWLSLADKEKLAQFWKLLHGYRTELCPLPHLGDHTLPPELDSVLASICRDGKPPLPLEIDALFSTIDARSNLRSLLRDLHVENNVRTTLFFRDPKLDDKYHLAPKVASCTSSISISICHPTYASFAASMDQLFQEDGFTLA